MTDKLSSELSSLRIDRSAPPEKGPWLQRGIIVLVLGALVGGGALAMPYLEAQVFKTTVELTEITLVSPAQASVELTASGYVKADVASTVSPKVPGRVIKVHVRQGDTVRAGDPLLELDASDDQARVCRRSKPSPSRSRRGSQRPRARGGSQSQSRRSADTSHP